MLKQIAPDIFYTPFDHATDRPNLGYVRGFNYALMFDAGASPAHVGDYNAALETAGLPLPDFCAISHSHWDHTYGICALRCPSIASRATNAYLADQLGWEWSEQAMKQRLADGLDTMFGYVTMKNEYPNVGEIRVCLGDLAFSGELLLDLGGLSCRLIEIGGPHSDDSVICYIPERKFVFLSDSPGKNLDVDFDFDPAHPELVDDAIAKLRFDSAKLEAYRAALAALDFDLCLSGHAEPITRAQLFDEILVQPR